MRRKLFCLSLAFIFGTWTSEVSVLAAAGIVLAASFYAFVLYIRPEMDDENIRRLVLICAVFTALGAARYLIEQARYPDAPPIPDNDGKQHIVTAKVINVEHKRSNGVKNGKANDRDNDTGFALTVDIISIDREKQKGINIKRCLLSYYVQDSKSKNARLVEKCRMIGNVIRFSGKIDIPEKNRNPRCFDYRVFLKGKKTAYISSTKHVQVIYDTTDFISKLKREIIILRERFIDSVEKDETIAALMRGMLFGDTSYIPEDLSEDFRRNGTAHILAVSGLHIGLLYGIFKAIRKRFRFPGISAVFVFVLLSYGTMSLWSVSVTRVILMIILMELGDHIDRRYDLLTSLGFVSMLSLMANPYYLYSASFLMSYIAILSIGTIGPVLEEKFSKHLSETIRMSLSVQLGLIPYTAYAFNTVPLGAIVINIPVILIMSLTITLIAISVPVVITASLIPFTAVLPGLIYFPAECCIRLLIYINELFAEIQFLSPDVISPPLPVVILVYGIIFLFCSENFRIEKIRNTYRMVQIEAGLILVVTLLSCFTWMTDFDKADIVMVDVGQGDSMHIKAGGKNYLVDGGGSDKFEVGKKTLKPYLLKNEVSHIDGAFVSHLHTDHYRGICELAKDGMIDSIFVYEMNHLKVKQIMNDTGLSQDRIFFLRKGHKILLGKNSMLEVLWPPSYTDEKYIEMIADEADENDSCLIMKITVNGVSLLATGDLGENGEHDIIEAYNIAGNQSANDILEADILKVGHHGSKTSSCDNFLDAVSPSFAAIQVGKNNMYGHPAKETIERLKLRDIKVMRNDTEGAVGFIISSGKVKQAVIMRNNRK